MRRSEAGFTLVEVLVSIVVLVFGLIAVTNLLIVAGTSNKVANNGTTAAAIATEQMEILKAIPFVPVGAAPALAAGGSLTADTPGFFRNSATDPRLVIPGGGIVSVRWVVQTPVNGNAQLAFITVEAEAPGIFAARSRARFTAFRACTGPVPDQGVCRNTPTINDTPCCPVAP